MATTEYSYDTLNRLSGLTHKQGSTVLSGYTYAYDGMSRLASVTSTIEGFSSYSYDATSQVVGADHASGGQADESYSYDANGNRNSLDYTVDTNNHITADATFTYAYDDQGNRTSRTDSNTGEVTEYSWDYRNRLVTAKDRNRCVASWTEFSFVTIFRRSLRWRKGIVYQFARRILSWHGKRSVICAVR